MAAKDTIYAAATAPGKAGIAILRLSGTESEAILTSLGVAVGPERGMRLSRLHDASGEVLDEALVLRFAEGASYTGERSAELHLHGSPAVMQAVTGAIEATGLARLARPGEFTRRALEGGRIDLVQAEGLADLIDAETEAQRRQAFAILAGDASTTVALWRADLLRAMALLEATIDFADEDVPEDVGPEVASLIARVGDGLARELAGAARASRVRSGFEIALVGSPNVGKSSLINYLSRSDAAIVSKIAGTTRDVLEVRLDVGGLPVTMLDMAGLRATDDPIEGLGVAKAIRRAGDADLRVFLVDGPDDEGLVERRSGDVVRRTKIDIRGGSGISVVSGDGIDDLLQEISDRLTGGASNASSGLSRRGTDVLAGASVVLEGLRHGGGHGGSEVTVERLRDVVDRLDILVGSIDVEDVLDVVFRSFCLGK